MDVLVFKSEEFLAQNLTKLDVAEYLTSAQSESQLVEVHQYFHI